MDKAAKIEEMEDSLRDITESLRKLKAEYLREEKIKDMKDKLYIEVADHGELHFKYNDVSLVCIDSAGSILYTQTEKAQKVFTEWLDKHSPVDSGYCNWKGRLYHLTGTGNNIQCTSETAPGANWERSPLFRVGECYGCRNCTDPNIRVVPHNKRAIVYY